MDLVKLSESIKNQRRVVNNLETEKDIIEEEIRDLECNIEDLECDLNNVMKDFKKESSKLLVLLNKIKPMEGQIDIKEYE